MPCDARSDLEVRDADLDKLAVRRRFERVWLELSLQRALPPQLRPAVHQPVSFPRLRHVGREHLGCALLGGSRRQVLERDGLRAVVRGLAALSVLRRQPLFQPGPADNTACVSLSHSDCGARASEEETRDRAQ
eukprot:3941747-Rhodomonas_salina.1